MIALIMARSTAVAEGLRAARTSLGISQSQLARLSGVSRFKICTYELGDGSLRPDEQDRIREALQAEAVRIRAITIGIGFDQFQSANASGTLGLAQVAQTAGISVTQLAAIRNGLRQPTTEEFERLVGALRPYATGAESASQCPDRDARRDCLPMASATERP